MKLIPATKQHLSTIMEVIEQAQLLLKMNGIDQWQNGYPNVTQIAKDINNHESYVMLDAIGNVAATVVLSLIPERTYLNIEGEWLSKSTELYGVIHRLAVHIDYRKLGVAQRVLASCERLLVNEKICSLKIDTHEDNRAMQKLLSSCGYSYCGIVYLEDGAKRLGYEKLLC